MKKKLLRKLVEYHDIVFRILACGLAICTSIALIPIILHVMPKREGNSKPRMQVLNKCDCMQQLMKNLGLDELLPSLANRSHYEKFRSPYPLASLVSPYCADLIDDIDLKPSRAMKRMDKRCYRSLQGRRSKNIFAKEAAKLIAHLQSIGVWIAMSQGTALGSQRAHGFLPWDDDFDFMVLGRDRELIEKKLLEVNNQKENKVKFFIDRSDTIGRYRVRCNEQKDICAMTMDLWFVHLYPTFLEHYTVNIPIDDILPLTLRPFEGYWFPAPARTDNFLKISYGENYFKKCVFHNHMPLSVAPASCPELPCSKLKWRSEFPHVEFCHFPNGWSLELRIKKRRVQSLFLYRT